MSIFTPTQITNYKKNNWTRRLNNIICIRSPNCHIEVWNTFFKTKLCFLGLLLLLLQRYLKAKQPVDNERSQTDGEDSIQKKKCQKVVLQKVISLRTLATYTEFSMVIVFD